MKTNRYNLIILIVLFVGLFLGCKEEKHQMTESLYYKALIQGSELKLEGQDYFLSSNNYPIDDERKTKKVDSNTINLKLSKPSSDSEPHTVLVNESEIYTGSNSRIELSIKNGLNIIEIKTSAIQPFRLFVYKIEAEEVTDSEPEMTPDNSGSTKKKDKEKEDPTPDPEPAPTPIIDPEPVPIPKPDSTAVKKRSIVGYEHRNNPDYVPLYRDGVIVAYVEKKSTPKPEPKKVEVPSRLRSYGKINGKVASCDPSLLDTRNGPFIFNITPKKFIDLKNITIIGASEWTAEITIKDDKGKVIQRNGDEKVVSNSCEISLDGNGGFLYPDKTYEISIRSNGSQALLYNLKSCNGQISSNADLDIYGDGVQFIQKLTYKY